MVIAQFAIATLEHRRHRAACGHDQRGVRGQQITLRGHAAHGFSTAMRLRHEQAARLAVLPQGFARGGIERVEKDAVTRPDAAAVIHFVIQNHRTAARRPVRDHALIAHHLLRAGPATVLPEHGSIGQSQRVKEAVIARHKHAILPRRGSKTHRSTGEETPANAPRHGIQRIHLVICRTAKQHEIAHDDRLKRQIILHALRSRPCGPRSCGQAELPALAKLVRNGFLRVTAACGIATIGRPVGGQGG